jgi:hypothetical protein
VFARTRRDRRSRARDVAIFSPCAASRLRTRQCEFQTLDRDVGVQRVCLALGDESRADPAHDADRLRDAPVACRRLRTGISSLFTHLQLAGRTHELREAGDDEREHVEHAGLLARVEDRLERARELVLVARDRGEVVAEAGEPDDVERAARKVALDVELLAPTRADRRDQDVAQLGT